ncbi:hypothetical protein CJF42_21180 [Pseudoalteromonas sp. NBT06-2]|uniref:hypothetical protein n=1 Tax=Pseudoalteromonas sp. NBT06-2 TaxID=2025950 RepID=UPI000BA76FD5|nr:hypothetical protein [Pseudoalteromonas sp. NBT06-2]PAJ72443.1 hypothetical protein CJF42_21180 [Pseudoalteromonas sp. NBT06-2]
MEISNQTQPINLNSKTIIPNEKDSDSSALLSNNTKSIQLNISNEAKLVQEIDASSNKIDNILMSHLSSQQLKELDGLYSELETAFSKEKMNYKEIKIIDDLFEKVHDILQTSFDKLSNDEQKTVDDLIFKMDKLEIQLDDNPHIYQKQKPTLTTNDSPEMNLNTDLNKNKKSRLTVAELNALPIIELQKLPLNQIKKLNTQQINKLSIIQLNTLPTLQLKQLTPGNISKLNPSQLSKLSP